ncbi:MAG TPA: glycosyltransferase family 2 protein, partial [Flavobacteriales bacterium]|nr:glycosyltransferase family 2 protein [Flavobacteriales bacterium]
MRLSVVIPAHNEEGSVEETVRAVHDELVVERIDHELVVVNDHSRDRTGEILSELQRSIPELVVEENPGPGGYGYAVRCGLERAGGEAIAVMMADLSDSPADLVRFYRKMQEGYDCVFGSRWMRGGEVIDYPLLKRWMNRIANNIIRLVFRLKYDDCTNAFKLYR